MQSRRCDPGFSDSQPVPIPGKAPSSSHVSMNVMGKHWRVLTSSGSLYESPETDRPMFYGCIRIICAWGLHKWFGSWKYLLHNPDWSEFWSPEPKKKTIYSSTGISHSRFCWKWEAETGESRTLWASRLACAAMKRACLKQGRKGGATLKVGLSPPHRDMPALPHMNMQTHIQAPNEVK